MDVAIIGTGNVGGALARALSAAGHKVTVTSTSPDKAAALASEIGGRAAGSSAEAAADGEAVVLAVYFDAVPAILDEIADRLDGKILVDVTNRMNDNPGLTADGSSNAEQIQARVPNARVVKAFNTIFALYMNAPNLDGMPLDAFVAGTDAGAKEAILQIAGSLGFRPIDAGPLESARILEAMEALNIAIQMRDGGSWNNGWKLIEPGGTS
jgi:8-hydroxy-5-deazaflavin:NADPH oxidoreductase